MSAALLPADLAADGKSTALGRRLALDCLGRLLDVRHVVALPADLAADGKQSNLGVGSHSMVWTSCRMSATLLPADLAADEDACQVMSGGRPASVGMVACRVSGSWLPAGDSRVAAQ